MNDIGDGLKIDKEIASIYYIKANKNQNSDAIYNYALMIYDDDSIPENKTIFFFSSNYLILFKTYNIII